MPDALTLRQEKKRYFNFFIDSSHGIGVLFDRGGHGRTKTKQIYFGGLRSTEDIKAIAFERPGRVTLRSCMRDSSERVASRHDEVDIILSRKDEGK